MKNFVFSTSTYDEEAQKHAATKVLKEFRKKASMEGYIHPRNMEYTKFPGNYLKIKHGNFRSILTSKILKINGSDIRVYIALRMFARGDSEYDKFKLSNKAEKERDSITGKTSIDWDRWEAEVKALLDKPTIGNDNPCPTGNEESFLSCPLTINHDLFDTTIFETKEWINSVSEVDFTDFTNAAVKISDFVYDKLGDEKVGWYAIEFKEHAILAYKRNDGNWILAKLVEKRNNSNYEDAFPKLIPSDFQRGYPCTFLDDQDEWRLMELDSKSNMVLSSQQVDIVSNDIKYPLFLTGRAGSGKSTLLQYMFAEIILRYVKNKDEGNTQLMPPVYLSYSPNLIDDAKKLCQTLFEKNSTYRDELKKLNVSYKNDIQPILPNMFYVFKDLLCDCIERKSPGAVKEHFPNDKYISFPKFNVMWKNHFGKIPNAARDYGPSISWHVIRTYIKGWDSESFLTPDDYAVIGDKNKSVTQETFKTIYENVWKKWYSEEKGVWDDQDLAIYCLQEECVNDRFSAIFCDESQDFTRVEIDFILNSSSFAHRSIRNVEDFNKLPFVFAGDEFQTLNPTGFSWESLKSYFADRLCSLVGLRTQKGMIPDPEVLSENFRSTQNVVKLANRIQLLRASRFKEFSTPQKSHFSQEGNSVYCISPSDKFTLEKLKEKGVVLIVPANDGESVEKYITDSPLKDFVKFEDGIPDGITILNPTQAKGLEYPNVAIFGFNVKNNSGLQIDNLIKWFKESDVEVSKDVETSKDIDLKYQVSNAYVAVTRASSNLYIIDEANRNSFWAFALNQSDDVKLEHDINDLQTLMLNKLSKAQQTEWSEEEIGVVDYVQNIDISDENLKFMRSKEHRNDLENRADSLHDAKLMLQAASFHKSAGNKTDEARCRAKAATYDCKYSDAAEYFVKAGMFDEAIENYWCSLNQTPDNSVVSKIVSLSTNSNNKKIQFCRWTKSPSLRDLKIALNDMASLLKDKDEEKDYVKAWEYIVSLMLQHLQVKGTEGIKDIPLIANYCSELFQLGISVDLSKLAALAYEKGSYKEAIDVWDRIPNHERFAEYCKAKLKIEKYPKTIVYYEGTKDQNWYDSLLCEVRKNKNTHVDERQKSIICRAIRLSKDSNAEFEKYLPYMLRLADGVESTSKVLDDAISRKIKINREILLAIGELRYSDLQGWNRTSEQYVDAKAKDLLDAVEELKRMRANGYQGYLQRSLQQLKVKEFCDKYKKYSRNKTARLVYRELGKCFEKSGKFVNACIYYEWAAKQTDELDLKRYFDERWIVCKERQADNDNSDQYRVDALEKRHQLGIGEKELSIEPVISDDEWEKIYAMYVTVSNEIRVTQKTDSLRKDDVVLEKVKVQVEAPNEEHVKSAVSYSKVEIGNTQIQRTSSRQEIKYKDYSIIYFPQKKDVVIKNLSEYEYSVRIRCGKFPDDADYKLKNGRMYLVDDDTPTPFFIEIGESVMKIRIFDDDVYSGMNLDFDI